MAVFKKRITRRNEYAAYTLSDNGTPLPCKQFLQIGILLCGLELYRKCSCQLWHMLEK